MRFKAPARAILGMIVVLVAAERIAVSAWAQGPTTRDLTIEQKYLAELGVPDSDIKVTAWVDRQDDTYRTGDAVQIFVKTNHDAYITVVDVGTSGKVHILFPNKHHTDNRVLAHQVLQIPGPDAAYRIRVGGPAGHELIKVIATTRPGQVIRPDQLAEFGPFKSYRGSAEGLTRDLGIELKDKHLTGPESGAAMTNKVIRIVTDGAAGPRPVKPAGIAAQGLTAEQLFRVAETSFYGDGSPPDYREALRLFKLAAEAGHVGAMYRIGSIHEAGIDVDRDSDLALRWYRKAAALGNTQAMVRMALIHARTEGPRRDYSEAVRWLKKAAEQGDGVAMMNLGKMHDEGIGVDRSPNEAARYMLGSLRAGAWTALDHVGKVSEETRREIQTQLRQAGYYSGPLDGKVGPETRAAMIDFARAGA